MEPANRFKLLSTGFCRATRMTILPHWHNKEQKMDAVAGFAHGPKAYEAPMLLLHHPAIKI